MFFKSSAGFSDFLNLFSLLNCSDSCTNNLTTKIINAGMAAIKKELRHPSDGTLFLAS
jgi:hypothetical protein